MMKIKNQDNESRLANATIDNYQMMLNYCIHIHKAFSSMIDVANNDETVDADPVLRQWTEEQIGILEKIFDYNDTREELLETVINQVVSEVSFDKHDTVN
jgi:hypothetical protein